MNIFRFQACTKKLLYIITALLTQVCSIGQKGSIAQFAVWQPMPGQASNFENGYKQHLAWHKSNNDHWDWYGWYIVSGPRYGQFVDATFNHAWKDFDDAIKPSEDMADNKKNVFPFANLQTLFKVSLMPYHSTKDTFENKLKLVRLVTISISNIESGLKIVDSLLQYFVKKGIKSFQTFKVVDGGSLNQLLLLLGFNSWEELSISESIMQKITEAEQSLQIKTVNGAIAETLVFRKDMSLFSN